MKITIRKASIDDVVHLALLTRITFREAFGYLFKDDSKLIDYFSKSFSIESLKQKLNDNNNIFWIAFVDDLPVGYAKLIKRSPSDFINSDNVSELQRIYVLHDFLNLKIGHQLQDVIFNEVKDLKSEHLWLSVYVGNPKAIRFYKRYNYTHLGNHTFNVAGQDFEFQVMSKPFN